jgi:hypothetical protein
LLIIILLVVVAFIGWSYIKAKVRKQESDKFQALRKLADMENLGTIHQILPPSWVSESYDTYREFQCMVVVDLRRKNVPDSFFLDMWNNENDGKKLRNLARIMEENKCSSKAQAMAVADIIIHTWSNKISYAEKQNFLSSGDKFYL